MDATRAGTMKHAAPAEPAPDQTAPRGRLLCIRVNEPGKTEVNVVLPLRLAGLGLKFGGSTSRTRSPSTASTSSSYSGNSADDRPVSASMPGRFESARYNGCAIIR
jgi:hypothetical protein